MPKSGLLLCLALLLTNTPSLAADDEPKPAQTAYVELKPALVTNLNGGPDYIRCDVQLMTRQPERVPDIELHSPALRNEMLLLLADQDGNQLLTAAGKDSLQKKALAALRKTLKQQAGEELIEQLYFTTYYVR
jgi:flagellar FliL protein